MVSWIQKSGTAHTIKDLEKALPSVASISSIQVKEFVQAMLDENEIKVEKIGTGNWYWSFPSEEKLQKEEMLAQANAEHSKAVDAVSDVKQSIGEAAKAREDIEMEDGDSRQEILGRYETLKKEVMKLDQELSKYADIDPVELKLQKERAKQMRQQSELYSDQIHNLADWIRDKAGVDRVTLTSMKKNWYGDQFDEEEQDLKELP
jgi:hypothetical protein